jgi:hypothetical protein
VGAPIQHNDLASGQTIAVSTLRLFNFRMQTVNTSNLSPGIISMPL